MPRESSDVYSICATLYHLLTGVEPFSDIIDSKIKHNQFEASFEEDFYLDTKVAEVLTWPLRGGMRRMARDRKTHLKDLHYHLDNLLRAMIETQTELQMAHSTIGSTHSNRAGLSRQTQSEIIPSPYSS